MLTAPRVVGLHPDGSLRVTPAPELELLRAAEPFVRAPGRVPGRVPLPVSYDLTVTARHATTITLLHAADRALTVRLDPAAGTVVPDRSGWPREGTAVGGGVVGGAVEGSAPIAVSVPSGPCLTVRVLVDGSLLELFAEDRVMVTERVYRGLGDVAELVVDGEADVSGWEQVPAVQVPTAQIPAGRVPPRLG